MVSGAIAQALREAEELKEKISQNVSHGNMKMLYLAKLQRVYEKILLTDLDYALTKKIEQDLWNFGFKNEIEYFQTCAKNKKDPRRVENQIMLSYILQTASGFYICLLHQICTLFKLEFKFRYQLACYSDVKSFPFEVRTPQLSSCSYICQYCLVHLGDLARYNKQSQCAEAFYKQALNVSPSNGQPYNQLGLLRAVRGDKLGAAYYHARSIAVGGPFQPAINNLSCTLASASSSIRDKNCSDEDFSRHVSVKFTPQTFINKYIVCLHKLHTGSELNTLKNDISELSSTFTALIATDEFDSDTLIMISCLDVFIIHSLTEGHKLKEEDLTTEEREIYSYNIELIVKSLTALLLPIHTKVCINPDSYPALPAIKFLLEWIRLHPLVLKHSAFISHPQIWLGLCTLLNSLQDFLENFSGDEFKNTPLPEDEELQGFLPINKAFENFKFDHLKQIGDNLKDDKMKLLDNEDINKRMGALLEDKFREKKKLWSVTVENVPHSTENPKFFSFLRAFRIVELSEWLLKHQQECGSNYFSAIYDAESGKKKFTPCDNPINSSFEVIKTIQDIAILQEKHLNEITNKENSVSKSVVKDEEMHDIKIKDENNVDAELNECESNSSLLESVLNSTSEMAEEKKEKRAGILKPQGSLEKVREEKALIQSSLTSPEITKIFDTPDAINTQDTTSSSSTVSQDGAIYTDINCLFDQVLLENVDVNKKELRKSRTNVAIQTIMKKQEESNKQVKFITPATTPELPANTVNSSFSKDVPDITVKKIIQPKSIKLVDFFSSDKKTGGILSLKNKAAGYPHLMYVDQTKSNVDSTDEITTIVKDESDDKKEPISEKSLTTSNTDTQKKDREEEKPVAENSVKSNVVNPLRHNIINKNSGEINKKGNQNVNSKQFINFSQNMKNSSISFPVINPKEIDVLSAKNKKSNNIPPYKRNNQSLQFPNEPKNLWQYDNNASKLGLYGNEFTMRPNEKYSDNTNVFNPKNESYGYNFGINNPIGYENMDIHTHQKKSGQNASNLNMPNYFDYSEHQNVSDSNNPQINPYFNNSQVAIHSKQPTYPSSSVNYNPYYVQEQYVNPNWYHPRPNTKPATQYEYNNDNNKSTFNTYSSNYMNTYQSPLERFPKHERNEFQSNRTDFSATEQNLEETFNMGIPNLMELPGTTMYSLFSNSNQQNKSHPLPCSDVPQQVLWPEVNQSPLEKLLEQQKKSNSFNN